MSTEKDAQSASRAVVDSMFSKTDNPTHFTAHHLESYNIFFSSQIYDIFQSAKPIQYMSSETVDVNGATLPIQQCSIFLGGKDGSKLRFGKPVIYDEIINAEGIPEIHKHYMLPNEARLRNMNYSMPIHYDMEIELEYILNPNQPPYTNIGELSVVEYGESRPPTAKQNTRRKEAPVKLQILSPDIIPQLEQSLRDPAMIQPIPGSVFRKQVVRFVVTDIHLGTFPIMVQSRFCILSSLPPTERFQMGECRNDIGGYFIIDGKEKAIIPQEQFADNVLYIKGSLEDDDRPSSTPYSFRASVRSVSENVNKPVRTFSIDYLKSKQCIVANIPNVVQPIPIFILFRALGVLSDKDILRFCVLDVDVNAHMLEAYRPSVHDGRMVYTQHEALSYIALFTRFKKIHHVMHLLSDFVLAHIGELNFRAKAHYLGYMCRQLVQTHRGTIPPTDRDHFKFKRVLTAGDMIKKLFREYFELYNKHIFQGFERILTYNQNMYDQNLVHLVADNVSAVTSEKIIHDGFIKAFKGNWGAHAHTKQVGVVQDMNRLSFNGYLSHLRKTSISLDSTSKVVGPRLLHCSQVYYFDPLDTPDGGNIGIHKYMSVSTQISRGYPRTDLIQWMRQNTDLVLIEDCVPEYVASHTRVFINGFMSGCVNDPMQVVANLVFARRIACLPIHTSICFAYSENAIYIYTDEGRVVRPIFYKIPGNHEVNDWTGMSSRFIADKLRRTKKITWTECIYGEKGDPKNNEYRIRSLRELYGMDVDDIRQLTPAQIERLQSMQVMVDFIDPNESESALIATTPRDLTKSTYYTHMEISESFLFGIMMNQVMFPEFNPPVRNLFSCGQTKQAVSMFSTNYPVRMDKMSIVLNYAEVPLVKTEYLKYTCNEENMYGHNALVAIGCFTSYNVEDAVLINEAAIQRGLFATTYYSTYSSHESTDSEVVSLFGNVHEDEHVSGKNGKYDYSHLNEVGIIKEGTKITERHILIGQSTGLIGDPERKDVSKKPKKEQLGTVDRTILFGKEGSRTAKVRVAELRYPAMGDKMASRAGQKGTIGLIVPERDMPFTADGHRPDIIVNPHAFSSRMTVCHLLEALFGSVAVQYGTFCNSTGFHNEAKCLHEVGQLMQASGLHSMGNELMYNGMTGEQMEMSMFVGPTYYMRLKHMVKDKMNYRAEGPNDQLTRQPVSGRASDGGLRMGEMERDVLIAHGMESFSYDAYMTRADKFYMAICNTTGNLFVYNPEIHRMFSPSADGPLTFYKSMVSNELTPRPLQYYNHSFSIIEVPFSFKLLMQEIQVAGIQMRIVTEDNVLAFTTKKNHTWNSLLHTDVTHNSKSVDENVEATVNYMTEFCSKPILDEVIVGPTLEDVSNESPTPNVSTSPYEWEHIAPIEVEPASRESSSSSRESSSGSRESSSSSRESSSSSRESSESSSESSESKLSVGFSEKVDMAPAPVLDDALDPESEADESDEDTEMPKLVFSDMNTSDDVLGIETLAPSNIRSVAKSTENIESEKESVDDILGIETLSSALPTKPTKKNPPAKPKKTAKSNIPPATTSRKRKRSSPSEADDSIPLPPTSKARLQYPANAEPPLVPVSPAGKKSQKRKRSDISPEEIDSNDSIQLPPKSKARPPPPPPNPSSPSDSVPVPQRKPPPPPPRKKSSSPANKHAPKPLIGDLVMKLDSMNAITTDGNLYMVKDICNNASGNCWVTIQQYNILENAVMDDVPPIVTSVGQLELYKRPPLQTGDMRPAPPPPPASAVTIVMNQPIPSIALSSDTSGSSSGTTSSSSGTTSSSSGTSSSGTSSSGTTSSSSGSSSSGAGQITAGNTPNHKIPPIITKLDFINS